MSSLHDILRGDVIPQSGVEVAIGRNSLDFSSPVVPLLDVHMRRAEFHDSGAPAQSGILSFHSEDNVLRLIPSQSGAQALVTAVMIDVYDAGGGQSVTTTASTIQFDTTRLNTHPEIYNFTTDGRIQIFMPGAYEFEFRVTLDAVSTTRTTTRTFLRRSINGGGTFLTIAGSDAYGYQRTTVVGSDTANSKVVLGVVEAAIFDVQSIVVTGGNTSAVANCSSFTIKKIA